MITSLRVQNFKAWADTGVIRLAPITVFFGANSSGKSSIQQFLLMLKQTAESPDRRRVFHAGGEGATPVALGSFRDYVFGHDSSKEIDFSLSWRLPDPLKIEDPKKKNSTFHAAEMAFRSRVGQGERSGQLQVREFTYSPGGRDGQPLFSVSMQPAAGRPSQYSLTTEGYNLVATLGRKWQLPSPVRYYGFPAEAVARYQNTEFVADLALALERQLRLVTYLGPLREPPSRNYKWSGDAPEHVGWSGERTIDAILAASNRRLNRRPKAKKEAFQEIVARWLKRMGLIEKFEIVPLAPDSDVYEARVSAWHGTETVLLPDVGFGVSQVLPVIAECFYAQPHSTIVMEQPEIHLHPAVQSKLADLFIETVRSGERGSPRQIQVVVESHSEHFLRRLQRRIAEEEIEASEVALYFCDTGPSGATLRPLDVDLFGNISNWPVDFFGDQMEDVVAQAKSGLKRQRAAKAADRGPASK